MIINLYSIRDNKTNFMQPVMDLNHKSAARNFQIQMANSGTNSAMGYVPEDFDLYYVGTFDNETGMVSPPNNNIPEMIVSGGSGKEI